MNQLLKIVLPEGIKHYQPIINILDNLKDLGQDVTISEVNLASKNDIYDHLIHGDADIVISQLTDIEPFAPSDDYVIAALTERLNHQYSLLFNNEKYDSKEELSIKSGTTVHVKTDLKATQLKQFNSNIQTKITDESVEKLLKMINDGQIDAIIVPSFLLTFHELNDHIKKINFHTKEMIPTPGQGVFALVTSKENITLRKILKKIHHREVAEITNIERKVMSLFPSEEQTNIGVYCYKDAYANYHVVGAYLNMASMTLQNGTYSQSTSEGLAEKLYQELTINKR